jgi:hypothetical protein
MKLVLEWKEGPLPPPDMQARLISAHSETTVVGQAQERTWQFSPLGAGTWFLDLTYTQEGDTFDSLHFALDIPDVTHLILQTLPAGMRIEQMGFLNDAGEFVDMLLYQDKKPFLTFSQRTYPQLPALVSWIHAQLPTLAPVEARTQLSQQLGDLAEIYPALTVLGHWQFKQLINPALLAHTSVAWKACLMQLLRNNLVLMDNESLYETLQEAAELAQQNEAMETLLALMEWDHDQQDWVDYPGFLKALSGQHMARTGGA